MKVRRRFDLMSALRRSRPPSVPDLVFTATSVGAGSDGRAAGLAYLFNTDTANSDPGTGKLKLNAVPASAVTMRISETDNESGNLTALLATLDDSTSTVNAVLVIRSVGTPATFAAFEVGTLDTAPTGYVNVTVTYVAGAGAFGNNDPITLEWYRTGDKGDTGATGATGATGSAGADGADGADGAAGRDSGYAYQWDPATDASDPGSSYLKFNHATLGSATAMYISETDQDGNGMGAILGTWDDSDSTVKGFLLLRKVGTPATWIAATVTGSVTDNGSWRTVPVSVLANSGVWSDGDDLMVTFYRTGDKGDTGAAGADGSNPPDYKSSVRVATTGSNITISTALNNGDTLDGVTLATNDRVLVKDQSSPSENGIYIVDASPTRATDSDAAGELSGGTQVYVEEGTLNADSIWAVDTNGSITPGSTSHTWKFIAAVETDVPHYGTIELATRIQGSGTAGTNNQMRGSAIRIRRPTTVTGLTYTIGSAASGNVRAALYDSAGTRVANRTTNSAQAGTDTPHNVAFDSAVTLKPGVYYACLIFSSSTATAHCQIGPTSVNQTEGGFSTPASITPPSSTPGNTRTPIISTY